MASTLDRIQKLRARRYDATTGRTVLAESRLEKALPGSVQDAREYIIEAMEPLPAEYTANTFAESERVQNQIAKALSTKHPTLGVEFEHQGSVTNNTHIKVHSDIDLLVVPTWFFCVRAPLLPVSPYAGDPVNDLLWLRQFCEAHLAAAFTTATIDGEGAKAISLLGGSLRRKIDVVPANWLDTPEYHATNAMMHRGVMVLDAKARTRIINFPFKHNYLIDQKDIQTRGGLRAAIRFLKNIKADEELDISSYDIASLCYTAPAERLYTAQMNGPLMLALEIIQYTTEVLGNDQAQASLMVPNGTRRLFGEGGIKIASLVALVKEAAHALRDAFPKQ